MEIFGGFMVMMGVLCFLLTVLWFILPFVIFAMKGKLDRAYELLEAIDLRLAAIEKEAREACSTPTNASVAPAAPDTPLSPVPPSSVGG
ncbi:MAG: hypothetical protein WA140_05520 [Geobacteraceae bacterium]